MPKILFDQATWWRCFARSKFFESKFQIHATLLSSTYFLRVSPRYIISCLVAISILSHDFYTEIDETELLGPLGSFVKMRTFFFVNVKN